MACYIVTERGMAEGNAYGIAAVSDHAEIERIDDIAPSLQEVLYLAGLLQTGGVAVEHFKDVVEDYVNR